MTVNLKAYSCAFHMLVEERCMAQFLALIAHRPPVHTKVKLMECKLMTQRKDVFRTWTIKLHYGFQRTCRLQEATG